MSKVNIVFFNVPKNLPMIGELMRYYQGQDDFETADVSNPSEVSQLLSMSGNGVIIFKVENKPDLQAVVTLLKSQKKLLRKGLVKTACLSFVKSKKVEKILAKYGCQEVLNPRNITSKTFSFKINFWSKNIRAQLVREEKDAAFQQKSNNANAKDTGTTGGKKEDFKHCEALTLPSDIWISKLKIDHKRILKRYLSRLMGPSPHMGKWMELEPQPGDRLPTWKFVLKDPEGQLIMEDGAWYFSGSRPEFDWKINRWNFSSERPHLYFYTKDGNVHSRLKYENGQVLITENSSYALTKEQYILQTCESTFAFDNENEEAEQGENLEGDSADDLRQVIDFQEQLKQHPSIISIDSGMFRSPLVIGLSGGSILITSAPKSARKRPASGPAQLAVISRTRMPIRGRSRPAYLSGSRAWRPLLWPRSRVPMNSSPSCCPSRGAGERIGAGVSLNKYGNPGKVNVPASRCSISWNQSRAFN